MPLNGWLWAMGALRNYAQQRRQQMPQRGFGLSVNELEPILRVGGDAAEMKFMECCRYLWQADGAELTEPFIEAAFNKLPEKSRCVLFQRMLTIVYVAQDAELSPP
jgi:hypothetical protein